MNPALKKLGFDKHDRALIIHADDLGMYHGAVPAFVDLLEFGLVSSAAVMVPCPWFQQVAAFCGEHPEIDMGVHLTLNSEWEEYRWGPISTRDPASGMLDGQGYFHPLVAATEAQADTQAVAAELRAQIARARGAGIDITHIDSHMGALARPRFVPLYIEMALENQVALPFRRGNQADPDAAGALHGLAAYDARLTPELEERGVPMIDALIGLPLGGPPDHVTIAKQMIDELQPGLTLMILHPSLDTPELRAMAPDWRSRVANYEALRSTEVRDHVRRSGVQIISYRPLRDLMRSRSCAS
jgi:predicted glycoside hydrolase/deacetylase ChbG (UPF0249 family)